MEKPEATPIGGYFELELPKRDFSPIHPECTAVNSGRNALLLILKLLNGGKGVNDSKIKKIFVPNYTCEAVVQPIKASGVDFEFYPVSLNLRIKDLPKLKAGEFIIVTNYFGIEDAYIKNLSAHYGSQAIIDNCQAWFAETPAGNYGFYSPRKFFGIPDGGYLCGPIHEPISLTEGESWNRTSHLLKRLDLGAEAGYSDFKSNSSILAQEDITKMSPLSHAILNSIDMEKVKEIRRKNFALLHESLGRINQLELPSEADFECPMVYPLLLETPGLRKFLLENKIFTATYWPNVFEWCPKDSDAYKLAEYLIPLPIDQRYGEAEMERIIRLIRDFNSV